jgi:hypothetical protein
MLFDEREALSRPAQQVARSVARLNFFPDRLSQFSIRKKALYARAQEQMH